MNGYHAPKCEKCGTALVGIPCPDKIGTCYAAHTGCPVCRAVRCLACEGKVQPEAFPRLCGDCVERAMVWAARQSIGKD